MGPPRFFAPRAAEAGSTVDLPDEEAAQLTRVLRLGVGDRVRVFDGRGSEWTATVEHASRSGVRVALGEAVPPRHEPRIAVTLAAAVLKGDRMDNLVRDAVMLGAAAIQPLITTRTEMSRARLERSGRRPRWQRIAVASAKQCGRAVVPEVKPAADLAGVLSDNNPLVMLIEPGAPADVQPLRALPRVDRATLAIGPEGGWTEAELTQAAARGALLVTLGQQTLRADAVPIVALTALRVHWDDF